MSLNTHTLSRTALAPIETVKHQIGWQAIPTAQSELVQGDITRIGLASGSQILQDVALAKLKWSPLGSEFRLHLLPRPICIPRF